jgi:fatty-acyl-CoA synthase
MTEIRTLIDALLRARTITDKGYTFLNSEGAETFYSFQALSLEADKRGRYLLSQGLKKGDRVGLVLPEPEDFVLTFLGAISAGLVPVPMYPPLALGKLDNYMDTAARILSASRARRIITSKKISSVLWSLLDRVRTLENVILVEKLAEPCSFDPGPAAIGPEDTCFLQFTSGSTSDPKGVIVTHANLVANSHSIMFLGLKCNPEHDKGVTWLPLYHDMGLIGFVIAPLVAQVAVVFIPTMSFVRRPTIWMDTIAKHHGTLTFAPNFAFALAAKYAARQIRPGFDLSCLHALGCGAEPINASTLRRFIDAFAPANLNPNVVMPAYGMAEATLAISFDPVDQKFHALSIDRDSYQNDGVAKPALTGRQSLEVVACGRPFPGHDIAIVDDHGSHLPEGSVGEIILRGPSVTRGYFENPTATAQSFRDGWLYTGDLGFLHDGELYISGRKKDLIILNGRNYHPQAIEWEAERVEGVRKGNVVAFAQRAEDTEKLVIVAETRREDRDAVRQEISLRVKEAFGLVVAEVVLIRAGALPKTSSGKLQRKRTQQQYEDGLLGRAGVRSQDSKPNVMVAKHITTSLVARIRHRMRQIGLQLAWRRPREAEERLNEETA